MATSGQWLDQADATSPAVKTYGVLYGLHMARFADVGLRWALFGFGVLGSLMIATGMVLWSVKRSAKSQTQASRQGAGKTTSNISSSAPAAHPKAPFPIHLWPGHDL